MSTNSAVSQCVRVNRQRSPCRPCPQVSCNNEDSAVQEQIFLLWPVPSLHFLMAGGRLDRLNDRGQLLEAQYLQCQVE